MRLGILLLGRLAARLASSLTLPGTADHNSRLGAGLSDVLDLAILRIARLLADATQRCAACGAGESLPAHRLGRLRRRRRL
jgi:hypothetical protein